MGILGNILLEDIIFKDCGFFHAKQFCIRGYKSPLYKNTTYSYITPKIAKIWLTETMREKRQKFKLFSVT